MMIPIYILKRNRTLDSLIFKNLTFVFTFIYSGAEGLAKPLGRGGGGQNSAGEGVIFADRGLSCFKSKIHTGFIYVYLKIQHVTFIYLF